MIDFEVGDPQLLADSLPAAHGLPRRPSPCRHNKVMAKLRAKSASQEGYEACCERVQKEAHRREGRTQCG
ncbi:hypothetical protein E2C01_094522 [Portunus trituberculatus]|uniref:Uncharacterized protein n=1 Tax=Portunus trituberculatus TaxID=210409 RepID=A0A5B7JXU4_PORTR|nr:hypothetical protein [Portunus trituberculatus]